MRLLVSISEENNHKDFVASFRTDRKFLQAVLEGIVSENNYFVGVCTYNGPITPTQTEVKTFSDMCLLASTLILN